MCVFVCAFDVIECVSVCAFLSNSVCLCVLF